MIHRKRSIPHPRVRTGNGSPERRPQDSGSGARDLNSDPLLTEAEAAAYLSYRPRTLASWRHKGRGPKFVAVSKTSVRYRKSHLDAWIASKVRRSTSDEGDGL